MDDTNRLWKERRLEVVLGKITQVTSFLTNYLPVANAHNSDFIFRDHWNEMIPHTIATELLSLSDSELISMPAGVLPQRLLKISSRKSTENLAFINQPVTVPIADKSPNIDGQTLPVWSHKTLADFVTAARSNVLPELAVLSSFEDFAKKLSTPVGVDERVVIRNFMSIKKSYEVDIMTDLCAKMAKYFDISEVIDIGSGLGYLGCHLALMHGLRVLGVDSSTQNTSSAETRTRLLRKQWHGIIRNATKKEKKKAKVNRNNDVDDKHSVTDDHLGSTDALKLSGIESNNLDYLTDVSRAPEEVPPSGCRRNMPTVVFEPVTQFVTSETNLEELVVCHLPALALDPTSDTRRLMLTGLHTCGDLSASILRLFVNNPTARALCQVGCCYNLLSEQFLPEPGLFKEGEVCPADACFPMSHHLTEQRYQLGRNARNLACHCPQRVAHSNQLPTLSIFWRSLLQVVLCDVTGDVQTNWRVGKMPANCRTFHQYAHNAVEKLGLKFELSDDFLEDYLIKWNDQERKNRAFFQLKMLLAPCIESLILLDRLAYLLQQDDVQDASIVQLFDAVESPRCYAIIANKSTTSKITT